MPDEPDPQARRLVDLLTERGLTLATGESLTAGLLAATMAEVPGCSAVLRGGVIAYDAEVKARLLAVPAQALAHGLVSREVAEAMAVGAADALGADLGVGTTGVAGPEPHGGEPAGSVWIAVAGARTAAGDRPLVSEHLSLTGDRAAVRCQTVAACLALTERLVGRE